MLRYVNLGSLFGISFLLAAYSNLQAQTETQTFTSAESAEAAGWIFNEEGQNPERDCDDCETDLGWKDSNFAGGGTAGEGGGLLHRSFSLPIGFYADTTIGELNLDAAFMASGKVTLQNIDFNGHAYLGFFNAETLLDDPLDFGAEVAFCIAEPGGGVDPNFRWGHLFTDNDLTVNHTNTTFLEGIPDGEPVDFSLSYNPDEGDGAFTFVIGEEPEVFLELDSFARESGATLNAFGVFTSTHGGGARPDSMEIFIDDVTYTSLAAPSLEGDFNLNGELDTEDIDLLSKEVATPTGDLSFDLNSDGVVDDQDRTVWVHDLKMTWFGDADLSGEFNSADFVQVFAAGKYEDADVGNASWSEGDWDGNMEFDSGDLVVAFQDGGFEVGPRAPAAVPEPTSTFMFLVCTWIVLGRRCQRR